MKKRMMVLLVAILILSLCSCGRSEPAEETAEVSLSPAPIEKTEQVEETASNDENVEPTPEESLASDENMSAPDEEGLSNSDSSLTPLDEDGTIFEDENDTWIQNEDGVVIASFSNGDFDAIAAYGEGYYGLVRDCSSFDSAGFELGVISIDGTWVVDYFTPTDSYFYYSRPEFLQGEREKSPTHIFSSKNLLEYCGEGVFCYPMKDYLKVNYHSCHFISTTTQSEFVVEQNMPSINYSCSRYGEFSTECPYIVIECYNSMLVVGLNGVIGDMGGGVREVGPYADGGFVYYQEVSRQRYELRFFDCATCQSTSICQDPDRINRDDVSTYAFENGQLDITLNGSDGQTYYATVDKQGNYITEPHL